jgi:hypothetical protein
MSSFSEDSNTYKQGKKWESEAAELLKGLGFTVKDNSNNFLSPDIIIGYKNKTFYVEAKMFNHKAFNVHKIKTGHFFWYQHREEELNFPKVAYFYWHPEGAHEVYDIGMISRSITNFSNPQFWSQGSQFFFHFPRGNGIPYEKFFANLKSRLDNP